MSERGDIGGRDTGDDVLATYREIAARFALGSSTAARVKAKRQIARGRWSAEPANHPADPIRIKIPREDWDQGADLPEIKPRARRSAKVSDTPDIKAGRGARSAATLAELREQLERERARTAAAEAELAELRRQLETQRGFAVAAEQRAEDLRGQLGQAEAALDEVRAAIAGLTADVARAVSGYRLQSFLHLLRALFGR